SRSASAKTMLGDLPPVSRVLYENISNGVISGEKYEIHVFEVDSSGFHDGTACHGAASEGNLVDVFMGCKGCTGSLTVTADNIDDAGWESGFFDKVTEVEGRKWSLFGSLQNNSVAGCKSWTYLPTCH